MKWNNSQQRLAFEREQAELRKEYLKAGMSEEQIQVLHDFDKQWHNGCRREAEHTQKFNRATFFDDDEKESNNPLYKRFLHNFATTDKHWDEGRFDWIEEIENKELYRVLSNMSEEDKEILTEVLFDGFTQGEVAARLGVNQSSISRKITHLKKIIKNFL